MIFEGHTLYNMIKMFKQNKKVSKNKKETKKYKNKTNQIKIEHWHGVRAAYLYNKKKQQ